MSKLKEIARRCENWQTEISDEMHRSVAAEEPHPNIGEEFITAVEDAAYLLRRVNELELLRVKFGWFRDQLVGFLDLVETPSTRDFIEKLISEVPQ